MPLQAHRVPHVYARQMPPKLTTLGMLLVAAGSAIGQVRVHGRVETKRGGPWASANVTLVSRPYPMAELIGRLERIETKTDAAGRFSARMRSGRCYEAWAWAPTSDGLYRVTDAAVALSGTRLVLRESPRARPTVRIVIDGLSAWDDHKPFRYVLHFGTRVIWSQEVEPGRDGSLLVPPTPGWACWVTIYERSGLPLVAGEIEVDPKHWEDLQRLRRPELLEGKRKNGFPVAFLRQRVRIGEPTHVQLNVESAAGDPVRAARVLARTYLTGCPERTELAMTGRNGTAELVLPKSTYQSSSYLPTDLRVLGSGYEELRVRAPARLDKLTVHLQPGAKIRGRVLLRNGQPAKQLPLLLFDRMGNSESSSPVVVRTTVNGRFEIDHREIGSPYSLTALLLDQHLAQITTPGDRPLHNMAWLAVSQKRGQRTIDLGDIVIEKLAKVDVQVVDPEGLPARNAMLIVLAGWDKPDSGLYLARSFRADRVGRVRLLFPAGGPLLLGAAVANVGYKAAALTANVNRDGIVPVRMRLESLVPVTGTAVDEKGRPMAGLRVCANPRLSVNSNLDRVFVQLPRLLGYSSAFADEHGRFRLLVWPDRVYDVGANYHDHGGTYGKYPSVLKVRRAAIDRLRVSLDSKLDWVRK